jgi:DNA-binding transcriptional MerR regulator
MDPVETQLQTKKIRNMKRKCTEEGRERNRSCAFDYRKRQTKGFNLLEKCVPGIEKLSHPDMLTKTVKYIKELQNEIKEVKEESLKKSKELENKIKELEKELLKKKVNYIEELQKKIKEIETWQTGTPPREPHRSLTDTSEMADLGTGASESSPTTDDHSVILKSLKNKILASPTGASEAESDILTSQESLLASTEEEELPEFNNVEDLREWLGLSMDDTTPSEDLSPEEEMELLESGRIPEFNWTEDLRRCLEL